MIRICIATVQSIAITREGLTIQTFVMKLHYGYFSSIVFLQLTNDFFPLKVLYSTQRNLRRGSLIFLLNGLMSRIKTSTGIRFAKLSTHFELRPIKRTSQIVLSTPSNASLQWLRSKYFLILKFDIYRI
jgi:hypothetical protein